MKKILNMILILLLTISISVLLFYNNNYVSNYFDNIFNNLLISQKGASDEVIITNILIFVPLFLITFFILLFFFGKFNFIEDKFKTIENKFKFLKKCREFTLKYSNRILSILLVISIILLMAVFQVFGFIISIFSQSNIYQEYYKDPRNVKITFPNEKKNLIHIYLESMENSVFSKENGGDFDESIATELENLAKDNISFSYNDKLGGFLTLPGTTWTQSALIAQETAINYKPSYATKKGFSPALPNVISLGDILKENGYNLLFMMGSDGDFADRKEFFEEHGYEVYDYYSAIEENKIDKSYKVWWGYEDKKLFSYAKEKLTELANKPEPFAFNLLTVDTHFTDGYLDSSCPVVNGKKYFDVYSCSSMMVGQFIDWIKEQDFYENTVIVVTGDHPTMQENVFDEDNRYVYNSFINTNKIGIKENYRKFTTVDLFPTILSSLNVEIEGNQLGLGVNLFSDKKTITEILGYKKFSEEIYKNSRIYWKLTQN